MRSKYTKEAGLVLTDFSIKVYKSTKKVELSIREYKVIISNDKNFVIESSTGGFQLIDRISNKYSGNNCLNKFVVYEQRWNVRSLEDYIYAHVTTNMTQKNTVSKLKRKLYAFIRKESYFYGSIIEEIEQKISKL